MKEKMENFLWEVEKVNRKVFIFTTLKIYLKIALFNQNFNNFFPRRLSAPRATLKPLPVLVPNVPSVENVNSSNGLNNSLDNIYLIR